MTHGYLRFNPADACKLPRGEKHEIRPREEPEIAAFLKAIQGHQFEALYIVAFTRDVYGHVTEQMKQKSTDRMEGFIKDVLNR